MGITERYYELMGEDCITYLPEQPSGFAVLLLGDTNHFVEGKASYWSLNEGRKQLLSGLQHCGYTVFTSNLLGRHWGSDQAFEMMLLHYHYVMRKEILNKKIHLFAEGTGALLAIEMMKHYPELIRSVVMVEPCIQLISHLETQEKEFNRRRILKEIQAAYGEKGEKLHLLLNEKSYEKDHSSIPVLLYMNKQEEEIYEKYKNHKEQYHGQLRLTYHEKENKLKMLQQIYSFYRNYERML